MTAHTLCICINCLLGVPDYLKIKRLAFHNSHKALLTTVVQYRQYAPPSTRASPAKPPPDLEWPKTGAASHRHLTATSIYLGLRVQFSPIKNSGDAAANSPCKRALTQRVAAGPASHDMLRQRILERDDGLLWPKPASQDAGPTRK